MPRASTAVALRSRELLDAHFDEWRQFGAITRPRAGWVRTIREALGMSGAALAARLGVTAGAVTRLEQSEADDRIRLGTLRRAADSIGCDLVYVLVPRRRLTEVVRERAMALARRQIAAVEQTMVLEDQATGQTSELEERLAAELMRRGGLWGGAGWNAETE